MTEENSFDKVKVFCKEYGGEYTEEEHSNFCSFGRAKPKNAILMGWKSRDRIDLQQLGKDGREFDFIFDLDRIICFPNRKDCSIIGKKKEAGEGVEVASSALINMDTGIEQVTAIKIKEASESPILTVQR